jgi:hypothetical protein
MRNKRFLTVAAAVAAAVTVATPALAQGGGGTGGGGGGGGGGTGGGGGGGSTTTVLATPAIAPGTFDGIGPGPVYIHDSFGHAQGTRYDQGGKITDVGRHPEVNGIRAEYGNNKTETWIGPTVASGSPRWQFASVGPSDPYEPYTALQDGGDTGLGYNDGVLFLVQEPGSADTRPDALLPFNAPTNAASTVSGDTVGFYGRTAIGFTNSSATNANFESNGQVWLELDFSALFLNGDGIPRWTFHTNGLSGTTLTGTVPLDNTAFNRIAVSYDPVNHVAAATINGTVVASVPYTAQSIKYVGAEGTNNANIDNFSVWNGMAPDPMPAAVAAPATPATTKF